MTGVRRSRSTFQRQQSMIHMQGMYTNIRSSCLGVFFPNLSSLNNCRRNGAASCHSFPFSHLRTPQILRSTQQCRSSLRTLCLGSILGMSLKSVLPSTAFMPSMHYSVLSLLRNQSRRCSQTTNSMFFNTFRDLDSYFEQSPLFVTWNTRSSRHGRAPRLRGCIGNFDPLPLHKGLAEYALISAFRDTRFNKIEEWELESLECGYVSRLSNFLTTLIVVDLQHFSSHRL